MDVSRRAEVYLFLKKKPETIIKMSKFSLIKLAICRIN